MQPAASRLGAVLRALSCRLAAALALACLAPGTAAAATGPGTLEIVSKTGVHVFTIELAATNAQRARGLMYRKALAEGHGMLFDFHDEQPVSFWMHNTYISLDMIFIAGDGRITHIVENAKPLSDTLIPSDGPVLAVLEVIAGTVRDLGISVGDRVAYPIFDHRR